MPEEITAAFTQEGSSPLSTKTKFLSTTPMRCLRCGIDNPAMARYCMSCRSPIPEILPENRPPQATSLLLHLRSLKAGMAEGKFGPEEYRAGIEKARSHMVEARNLYISRLEAVDTGSSMDNQVQATIKAMEKYIVSVEEMAVFLEDWDKAHISGGLELAEVADIEFQVTASFPREGVSFSQRTVFTRPPEW